MPTTYASVELFLFLLCFHNIQYTAIYPNNIQPPVWLHMSGWTAHNTSTHNFIRVSVSVSNVNGGSIVFLRYVNALLIFFQSSLSGILTCVVSEATSIWVLG